MAKANAGGGGTDSPFAGMQSNKVSPDAKKPGNHVKEGHGTPVSWKLLPVIASSMVITLLVVGSLVWQLVSVASAKQAADQKVEALESQITAAKATEEMLLGKIKALELANAGRDRK